MLLPLLLLFSILCSLTFGLVLLLELRFVIAVVIGFPLFSLGWGLVQPRCATQTSGLARLGGTLRSHMLDGFPGQYNEICLISTSVLIGALLASQISPQQIDSLIATGYFSPAGLVVVAA